MEVLKREDQLRQKKEKKSKKGDSSKPKLKSRKGKGKKKKNSAKPGAKARKLLRSAKQKPQDSDEGEAHVPEGEESKAATPKAKAKAKSKAAAAPKRKSTAKAKTCFKKPAAGSISEPPKKRPRRKTSQQQQQQWVDDEKPYEQYLFDEIKEFVTKFTTEDAGNQFKKKIRYNLNFQMLHCSIDPYYSRQSCVTRAPKEITADGKDTSWCFSFHDAGSEKGGPHWQFEMACSVICAHILVPRLRD